MGYSIYIGNARPEFSTEYCHLSVEWVVDAIEHDFAPTFPNDGMTGNSNNRHPSYTGWSDFCCQAKLHDLFFDDYDGLFSSHPGCVMIQEHHVAEVKKALLNWRRTAIKPPGFSGFDKFNKVTGEWEVPDKGKYDHILARLIWLDYWMTWALENCEVPAISNS